MSTVHAQLISNALTRGISFFMIITQSRRRLAAICSGVSFFVFPLAHFAADAGADDGSTALLPANSPSETSSCNTQEDTRHLKKMQRR